MTNEEEFYHNLKYLTNKLIIEYPRLGKYRACRSLWKYLMKNLQKIKSISIKLEPPRYGGGYFDLSGMVAITKFTEPFKIIDKNSIQENSSTYKKFLKYNTFITNLDNIQIVWKKED